MAGAQVSTGVTIINSLLGFAAISLTNFDATTEPQIAAGSKCEVAGAFFTFDAAESITDWSTISNDTQAYVMLTPSGSPGAQTLAASYTATAPVWSTAKQGWYASAASAIRAVAGVYRTDATTYAHKSLMLAYGRTGGYAGRGAASTTGGAVGQNARTSTGGAIGAEATATLGGAIGAGARATDGGAVGEGAISTGGSGGAVGQNATATRDGGAIGNNAQTSFGGSCGSDATSGTGGAVGQSASATFGGAIGATAVATTGFAGGSLATANGDNRSAIGAGAVCPADNEIRLGASGTTTKLGDGTTVTSDSRDKADIQPSDLGLAFINSIPTAKFRKNPRDAYYLKDADGRWVKDKKGNVQYDVKAHERQEKKRSRWHHGFIAQEILKAIDSKDFAAVKHTLVNNPDAFDEYSIDYQEFIAPLVNAVKELSAKVAKLEGRKK